MYTTFAPRNETAKGSARASFSAFHNGTTCTRCGGLMVGEYCMDLPNGTGELEFLAARCVQCGEVVDPVILKNRSIQQQRRPPHSSELTTFSESIQQGGTL